MAEGRGEVSLPFAKYHGAGNDFVLVDGRPGGSSVARLNGRGAGPDWSDLARRVCDRHFGVGADGLLVAAAPEATGAAERMRMFNPDGSESEMCGNGLRCYVRWLIDRGEAAPGVLAVETGAGVLVARIGVGGNITVDMGCPRLAPTEIPLSPEAALGQPAHGPVLHLGVTFSPKSVVEGLDLGLRTSDCGLDLTCVSMGNPHAVAFVSDVDAFPLGQVGPAVERHPAFPARTNVEVVQVLARDRLRVRVWERGAGLTLACGTGACAAMVAARLRGLVDEQIAVELPGGTLGVTWRGDTVQLSGPVEHVFDGEWLMIEAADARR